MKLTKAMLARLREIDSFVPDEHWEYPAFWKSSRTDMALLSRGAIDRVDAQKRFSGHIEMTVSLCRVTPAGRAALAAEKPHE